MQLYIWENVREFLTDNYHNGGGLAIVAENLTRARELFLNESSSPDSRKCEILTCDPDHIYNVDAEAKEKVFIFPDAGCC